MRTVKPTNTSTKKTFILILVGVLALALAVIFTLYVSGLGPFASNDEVIDRPENSVDYTDPATKEQVDAGNKAKEDFINKDENNGNSTVQVSISSVSQNNQTLSIRTIVTGDTNGTCDLTLSRSGETSITDSVSTQNMGQYNVCAGFDLDISGLSKGEWSLSIKLDNVTATKKVTIE